MVKKAVIIGINYTGTPSQLHGCVNDAENMRDALVGHGYAINKMLTDSPATPVADRPTKANILAALRGLIHGATAQDNLFVHYSGHGTQVRDYNRDEQDGRDEAWMPLDYSRAGLITDDELHATLCRCPAKVVVVSDSCHSGTVMDLRVNYVQYGRHNMVTRVNPKSRSLPTQYVCISGCMDNQYSADTVAPDPETRRSEPQGAMTWCLLTILKQESPKTLTYRRLMKRLWQQLAANGYPQVPQLSASHHLDLNQPFVW